MGSWDCYCAICGGPLGGVEVSRKPRTARFRRKWAKAKKRRERGLSDDEDMGSEGEPDEDAGVSDEGEPDDDTESLDSFDEDNAYDPEVISEQEVSWVESLYVLGFHPEAKGASKAFLGGPGRYTDYGGAEVEEGSVPNADGIDAGMLNCYHSWESDDPVFPFHLCCYEILVKHHTGSFDVGKLDMDLMYSTMREFTTDDCRVLEGIDYGAASFMQEQFWVVSPGYEYLVSHPRDLARVEEVVLSMFGSNGFKALVSDTDPVERVRSDPFTMLPYDLIYQISTMLGNEDLLSLMRASWPVHAVLRDVGQFWQQRIRTTMPWFFELHQILEEDQTYLQENDPKRILLWGEKMTLPREWMTGPFLGVANRRRIWSVCEQLGEVYLPRIRLEEPAHSYVEKMIMEYSNCSSFAVTSGPNATTVDVARNAYWYKSWSDLQSKPKVFTTFWDGASLAGISLGVGSGSIMGMERRLLGRDDSTEGIREDLMRLQKNERITGVILHIPNLDICGWERKRDGEMVDEASRVATSPQGLTVILNTGQTRLFGTDKRGFSKRYLPVAPNWYMTGMTGMTGEIDGKQQFVRLGLLQAQHPELADYSILPEADAPPKPTPLQSLLWDEDYSDVLHHNIWDHPTLGMFQANRVARSEDTIHRDLIPHQALIWARDERDLRSLRRVSGYIVAGSTYCDEIYMDDVCGVTAEYTPKSALMRRMVGITKTSPGSEMTFERPWRHFEIDGPGGEIITEVQYAMHEKPKAIKIRTNRGRECYWGEAPAHNWQSLEAPPGETLVGLVMTFAEPKGCSRQDMASGRSRCIMSSVAALSMPLGVPEETQPVGQ